VLRCAARQGVVKQPSVFRSGLVRFAKALATGCWYKARVGVLRCAAAIQGVVKSPWVLQPGRMCFEQDWFQARAGVLRLAALLGVIQLPSVL
jgi:hypothetical protein